MSKLIKQIFDLVTLATDKGITGYWSDDQIMNAIDQGQMSLFRQLIQEFAKTRKIRDALLPFQKKGSVTITSRVGSIPSDFEIEIDWWVTVNGADYALRIIESGQFKRRLTDPIDPGTDPKYAFANVYNDGGNKIEVSSPSISTVNVLYFKRPTKPVYATTLSGGQYVYDDAGSTDIDWLGTMHDIIVKNALGILGLSIRDGQVQRAGQESIPKEATIQ